MNDFRVRVFESKNKDAKGIFLFYELKLKDNDKPVCVYCGEYSNGNLYTNGSKIKVKRPRDAADEFRKLVDGTNPIKEKWYSTVSPGISIQGWYLTVISDDRFECIVDSGRMKDKKDFAGAVLTKDVNDDAQVFIIRLTNDYGFFYR